MIPLLALPSLTLPAVAANWLLKKQTNPVSDLGLQSYWEDRGENHAVGRWIPAANARYVSGAGQHADRIGSASRTV